MFGGQEKPVKEITSSHPNASLPWGLLRLQDPYAAPSLVAWGMDASCQKKKKREKRKRLSASGPVNTVLWT